MRSRCRVRNRPKPARSRGLRRRSGERPCGVMQSPRESITGRGPPRECPFPLRTRRTTLVGMQIAPVVLEGQNVRLEPYAPAHFEELSALALSAPETFRFIPVRMQTRDDLVARFALAERVMASKGGVFFVTRLAATGEAVGSTTMILTDAAHRRIEIGFTWIVPRLQRTRVNTEAKLLQLTHAFEGLGAVRV